jgi:Tol biopolymer transport system component
LSKIIILFLVATLAGCSSSTKTTSNGAPPVEDFFRNSQKSRFKVSPNGKFISYLAPWEGRMNVFFEPRDGSAPAVRLTDAKDRDLADYFWKGNSTVVYRRDFSGDENFQLFSVNIDTQKATALTPFAGVRSEVVDDLEGIDESHVLFGMNKRNPEIFDVFRLDVTTGKMALAAKNPGNIQDWITDHHGKIRAAVTSDGVNHTLLVRDTEKGKFRKLLTTDFKESVRTSMPFQIAVAINSPPSYWT